MEKAAAALGFFGLAAAILGVVGAVVTEPGRSARNAEQRSLYIHARCLDAETHTERLRWCGTPPPEVE